MISNTFNLKQLEALVWVAELGSFRKAAWHLNTTQPNISARIASLETSLGVTLMLRDAGSVRVTEQGAELLKQARKVLRDAETMVEIARRPDLIEDRLRLGVTEMVACTWLRAFLRRVREAYPNLAVELTVDLSRNLDREMESNALDLAIQTAPFGSAATGVIELGSYDFVWVAAPQIAAALGAGPGFDDLFAYPILTTAKTTQPYLDAVAFVSAHPGPRARIVPSSSLTSGLHMALDGMGVAIIPRAMIVDPLSEGRLVEIAQSWTPGPLRFAARFQADKAPGFVSACAGLAGEVAAAFRAETATR